MYEFYENYQMLAERALKKVKFYEQNKKKKAPEPER